ncbi:MAG: hypothetical protein ACRC6I_16175, partial [Paracoccaceae bacterium]
KSGIFRAGGQSFFGEFAMSSHFKMTDLLTDPKLVENALHDGGEFRVSVTEAMALRTHLRGAIWSAETIRLTTDVARVIYNGGSMTTPATALEAFAASLVLDGSLRPMQQGAVSTTVVVLVIAAAAVIGYAIGHLESTLSPDLVLHVSQSGGDIRIWVPVN